MTARANNPLEQTAAAMLVLRDIEALSAAAAAELIPCRTDQLSGGSRAELIRSAGDRRGGCLVGIWSWFKGSRAQAHLSIRPSQRPIPELVFLLEEPLGADVEFVRGAVE